MYCMSVMKPVANLHDHSVSKIRKPQLWKKTSVAANIPKGGTTYRSKIKVDMWSTIAKISMVTLLETKRLNL